MNRAGYAVTVEIELLLKRPISSISDPKKACCLTWSIGDYQDVEIEDNSVLYCDVPYENTNKYVGEGENFDYERFYDWCLKQTQPLYIS